MSPPEPVAPTWAETPSVPAPGESVRLPDHVSLFDLGGAGGGAAPEPERSTSEPDVLPATDDEAPRRLEDGKLDEAQSLFDL